MTAHAANLRPRSAARRARARLTIGVTLLCAVAMVVLVNILGHRYSRRLDVSATGDQQLAPRTVQLLRGMPQPHRLIVAADLRTIDPRSRTNLMDVLGEMHAADKRFDFELLDTGAASGTERFRSVVAELAAKNDVALRDGSGVVSSVSQAVQTLSESIAGTLAPALLTARDQLGQDSQDLVAARGYLEQAAASSRLLARDLDAACTESKALLDRRVGDTPLPAIDKASAVLQRSLAAASQELSILGDELRKLAQSPKLDGRAQETIRPLMPRIEALRGEAAVQAPRLAELPRIDLLRAADILQRGSAALLLGETGAGLAAIDPEWLLPSSFWLDAADAGRASLRGRVEELICSALGALLEPVRPLVVLVHPESRLMLDQLPIESLWERLSLRGIDLGEWPLGGSQFSDPGERAKPGRPVVYIMLSPESAAAAGPDGVTGAQKAQRVGAELTRLLEAGKPVLVSLSPSILGAYGDKDPVAAPMRAFGIIADSGTPLLTEFSTPQGRFVETDRIVQAAEGEHALAGVVRGLPTYLTWTVPLSFDEQASGVQVSAILAMPTRSDTWAETEWLRLRQTSRDQRSLLPEQPRFDSGRDQSEPRAEGRMSGGSWVIAAAAERSGSPGGRVVVVGSNDWFIDPVTQRTVQADGRPVLQNPGNLELFEASVSWLAGQDRLIAQSPAARAVPMIKPMEPRALGNLRLALSLGPAALTLLVGLLYRVLRR